MAGSTKATSPYVVNENLTVTARSGTQIVVKIVEIKSMTLSCVVLGQVYHAGLPNYCILKLYDRRFAVQLREDEEASPWDISTEQKFDASVNIAKLEDLFKQWDRQSQEDVYWEGPERDNWDEIQLETYLQFLCWRSYKTETQAYDRMKDLQGTRVPNILGPICLLSPPSVDDWATVEKFKCIGIMLQYIEGFPLSNLADNVSHEHWQKICDEAIRSIELIGERGICNRDVRPRNTLIERQDGDAFAVYFIDFGSCAFREQFKSLRDFEELQADQDEEGAIGIVMQRLLGYGYAYVRSARAERLLQEFKSEG